MYVHSCSYIYMCAYIFILLLVHCSCPEDTELRSADILFRYSVLKKKKEFVFNSKFNVHV